MKENILFVVEKKIESQLAQFNYKNETSDHLSSPYSARPKLDNIMTDLQVSVLELKEDDIQISVAKQGKVDFLGCEFEKENNVSEGQSAEKEEFNNGRWNEEEHRKFIEAILLYGNEWKRVQQYIKTRSSTQARSHAQKFFIRLKSKLGANNISLDHVDDRDPDKKQKFFDSIYYLLNQCLCDYESKNEDKIEHLMKEKFSTQGRDKLIKMIFNFHTKSGDYKRRKSSSALSVGDSFSELCITKNNPANCLETENYCDNKIECRLAREDASKDMIDTTSPKNSKLFKIEKNIHTKNRTKTFDYTIREIINSNELNTSNQNTCEISSNNASMPQICPLGQLNNIESTDIKNVGNVYEKLKSFFGIKLNEKKENNNPVWINLIEENLNLDCNRIGDHSSHNGNPFNINFENFDGSYNANISNNFLEGDHINPNNPNIEIEKMFSNMINFEYDYHNSLK
jgi:SHAQKYF class myb-like DNA-binding protein